MESIKSKKVISIVAATSSGKTTLAVELAKILNGEIISLDSRQVYKGMVIGTAQPTQSEMCEVPHHLFGFLNPWKPISAGEYADMVFDLVKDIQNKGKTPIICGGSGLYYRAVSKGIFPDSVSDLIVRSRLEKLYDKNPSELLDHLRSIDPEYADIVHINNKKRLVRALEIYETTGKPPSVHFHSQTYNVSNRLNLYTVMLDWNRESLIHRIGLRLDQMLSLGWIEEVKDLLEKQRKMSLHFPALNSIGYAQIRSYLNNEMSYDEMKEDIHIKTRQFARRQKQWFKKEHIDLEVKMDDIEKNQIAQILYCLFKVII